MQDFPVNTHLQVFTNAKPLEQICYKWLMAVTDSDLGSAKKNSGWADEKMGHSGLAKGKKRANKAKKKKSW